MTYKDKLRSVTPPHFCFDTFNDELGKIDWNLIIERPVTNIDEILTSFYKTFNKIVNTHAPIIPFSKRKIKHFSKPWISKDYGTKNKESEQRIDYINPEILRNINIKETKFVPLFA